MAPLFDFGLTGTFWLGILAFVPTVLLALAVLLVGWLIAKAVSRLCEKLVRRVTKTGKVKDLMTVQARVEEVGIDRAIGLGVYCLLMLAVVIIVLDILGARVVTAPLVAMLQELTLALPSLLKALLILLAAWVLATLVRGLLVRTLSTQPVSRALAGLKVTEDTDEHAQVVRSAGTLAYYLILILFLPAITGALQLDGLVAPLEAMASQALSYVPRLAAAGVTVLVGYMAARIVRSIVSRFLASIGTDTLPGRFGFGAVFQRVSLSQAIGTVAFVLILIPTAISALQSLGVTALTAPAISMLTAVLAMVPVTVGALLLLAAGIVLARWIGGLTATLVENVGLPRFLVTWGLLRDEETSPTVPAVVGGAVTGIVAFLVIIQVFELLQMRVLSELMRGVLAYIPHVFVAVLILAVGYAVGQFVGRSLQAILAKTAYPALLASLAKYAIFVLAAAMALEQLGVAAIIVSSAVIILLGAIGLAAAIAAGLAFGLGGREQAARWLDKIGK